MAAESRDFSFDDVAHAISDKMERRHPHVFGDALTLDWEGIKEEERQALGDPSALAGVALGLPALLRAEKLQKRAARTGFDWPDPHGARAKVIEEIAEIDGATDADALEDEMGDLLFAVVNWARKLGVDPEAALRRGNRKFEKRFRQIETMGGAGFSALSLDQKEALWVNAKRMDQPKRD